MFLLAVVDGLPEPAAAGEQQRAVVLLPLGEAEQGAGGPVDGQHIAALIQQDQALVHAVQNQTHLVPLVGNGLDVAPQLLHQLVNVAQDGTQLIVRLESLQPGGLFTVQYPLKGGAH